MPPLLSLPKEIPVAMRPRSLGSISQTPSLSRQIQNLSLPYPLKPTTHPNLLIPLRPFLRGLARLPLRLGSIGSRLLQSLRSGDGGLDESACCGCV
jgi:hypothetical protein